MDVDVPGVKRRAGRPCAWLQGAGYLLFASGAWWLFQSDGTAGQEGLRAQGVAPCAIRPLSATSLLTLNAFLVQQLATVTFDSLQSDTSESSQSKARGVSKTKHTPGKRTHLSTNALLCWRRGSAIVLTFKVFFQRASGWWTGVTATHTGRTNPEWGTC